MAATTTHSSLFAVDPDQTLWRYMSLPKFLSLVTTRKLRFSRLDKFDDLFEGTLPRPLLNALKRDIGNFDSLLSEVRKNKRATYASCWFASCNESEGLWKRFGTDEGAVAICTTAEHLIQVLPDWTYISDVRYIDYNTTMFNMSNLFWAALHKRREYEHEHEVRAFIWAQGNNVPSDILVSDPMNNPRAGVAVDVDLAFAGEIYFQPGTPEWLVDGSVP